MASAILAITAAAALPSSGSTNRAASAPQPIKPRYLGVIAEPQSAPVADTDPTIRRFTGKVGQDLSDSLAAAGVPELQGREYVALARACSPTRERP